MSNPTKEQIDEADCVCFGMDRDDGLHESHCPVYRRRTSKTDIVSQLRGDALGHRHYGRDWSAKLLERAAKEIERLRPMAESWQSYEVAEERKADYKIMLEAVRWKHNRWVAAGGIAIDVRGKKS